jgi:hypothetical protein
VHYRPQLRRQLSGACSRGLWILELLACRLVAGVWRSSGEEQVDGWGMPDNLGAQPRTNPNRFAADAITPTTMSSGHILHAVVNHQGPVDMYEMSDLI